MMEKEDKLREFAGMCSKSLSDDVELRQEVEAELLDHLEDAYEEECQNATEEEALKNAFKRFGNPEEISSQLVKNNAARLSWNARIRRAAKWLLVPLMVVGVLFCIDVRGIRASSFVLKPFLVKIFLLERQGNNDYYSNYDYSDGLKTRKLTADEQLLFDFYYNKERSGKIVDEMAVRLYMSNTNDPIYCATCALELASSTISTQEQWSKLMAVLDNGRRIDGINPLYDFIEAYVLMTSACPLSANDGKELNGDAITDCAVFEKAVVIYEKALTMGPVRTYGKELQEKVREMLATRRDLLGGMQLLDFEMRERIPYMRIQRDIAKRVPLYCEKLHADGKGKEALELLRTWRSFLLQWLEGNHSHYLDLHACVSNAKDFLKSAKKLDAKDDISALQAVVDWLTDRRDNASQATDVFRLSGLLGGAFVWPDFQAEESARKIERKLEAATFDVVALGLACVTILLIIVVYGVRTLIIRMCGRHPFLFVMSQDTYKSLFFKGILLPMAIYLLMCWVVAGIGGLSGLFWQLVTFVFLCLIWPICYGVFCRRAINERIHGLGAMENHDFKASCSLNMMCLYVVLLVVIGGIVRPVQTWRQHHYASQDTLLFPWQGVETAEAKSIREGYQQLRKLLNTEDNN